MNLLVEASPDWKERRRRLDNFSKGVFNIMKLALAYDLTDEALAQIKKDVRLILEAEARAEMMLYTNEIEIFVSGSTRRTGWWWGKKTIHRHINVEVTFDPYKMSLSAWTDPNNPGEVIFFQ